MPILYGMNALSLAPVALASADARTFAVLLSRMSGVQAALEALAKRYARKGLTLQAWTWGRAYTVRQHTGEGPCLGACCDGCENVSRVPLTIVGDAPSYAGWTFLAALTHLDGENIVRGVPGREVPTTYRSRGPVCDHCKANRLRSETYVLRHEDGRTVQVGSTCIGDFLGADLAGDVAAAATMLALARGIAEAGCEGSGSSGDRTLAEYLPIVAWCVREQGWVSRTMAREQGGSATADCALTYMSDRRMAKEAGCEPTAEDTALALASETWAESLSDEAIASERSDYLHNVRLVARSGLVTHKSAGIGASMITAYQRAIGRDRERAERVARPVCDAHVGTVGKRETFKGVTLDFVTGYETAYGYTTVLKFRTPEGACLVWKASASDLARADVGKRFDLTGTVKEHGDYKDAKQTMVTRCKVAPLV